jgi:hypothetical protein
MLLSSYGMTILWAAAADQSDRVEAVLLANFDAFCRFLASIVSSIGCKFQMQ